jgi:hypothetical protein
VRTPAQAARSPVARTHAVVHPTRSDPVEGVEVFETPKTVAPRSAAPLHAQHKVHVRFAHHVRTANGKRLARKRATHVPPGQIVKTAVPKAHAVPTTALAGRTRAATHGAKTPAAVTKKTAQRVRKTRPAHPVRPAPATRARSHVPRGEVRRRSARAAHSSVASANIQVCGKRSHRSCVDGSSPSSP